MLSRRFSKEMPGWQLAAASSRDASFCVGSSLKLAVLTGNEDLYRRIEACFAGDGIACRRIDRKESPSFATCSATHIVRCFTTSGIHSIRPMLCSNGGHAMPIDRCRLSSWCGFVRGTFSRFFGRARTM